MMKVLTQSTSLKSSATRSKPNPKLLDSPPEVRVEKWIEVNVSSRHLEKQKMFPKWPCFVRQKQLSNNNRGEVIVMKESVESAHIFVHFH